MRLRFCIKLVLALSASVALAEGPDFRPDILAFNAAPGSLREIARGRDQVTSSRILRKVGGVLFQGQIGNFGPIEPDRLRSEADVQVHDGIATITLRQKSWVFWTKEYHYVGPAWIIAESARFANTPETAAVTFFGEPSEEEKKRIYSPAALTMERNSIMRINAYNADIEQFNRCANFLQTGSSMRTRQPCAPVLANDLGNDQLILLIRALRSNSTDPSAEQSRSSAIVTLTESMRRVKKELENEEKLLIDLAADIRIAMEESGEQFHQKFFLADLHPELAGTQLGFRLLQADSLLNFNAFLQSTVVGGKELLFDGDEAQYDSEGKLNKKAQEAIASLKKIFQQCQEARNELVLRAWILSDFDIEYNVANDNDGFLQIEGEPFYYVWGVQKGNVDPDAEPVEFAECTAELKDNSQLYDSLNNNIWRATRESARASALFRSLKDDAPEVFSSILGQLEAHQFEFFTPRAWPRNGNL
ncbi:hypothetical protein E4L95_03390 [Paracoccus liaowanqingii]|uniref:Uncharacterized protein n=1 Tax=Paracoccus liaowanqingii TaxID=2560053 RepID=A0A4Z1CRF5_9RHOB|nr:hypothetical protein [Paracoccus liaowanqingii]TGN67868.1 hypothetical protein E4L95_03390 [Paracoccus liaowanqingii]